MYNNYGASSGKSSGRQSSAGPSSGGQYSGASNSYSANSYSSSSYLLQCCNPDMTAMTTLLQKKNLNGFSKSWKKSKNLFKKLYEVAHDEKDLKNRETMKL